MSERKFRFKAFPRLAGQIVARAHARSGDATVIAGYLGKSDVFDEAISEYGIVYAKQAEQDYAQFVKACKSGRLKAETID